MTKSLAANNLAASEAEMLQQGIRETNDYNVNNANIADSAYNVQNF